MMQPIDVLIVEDEIMLAEVYVEIIQRIPHFRVVGIASSLKEAKQLMLELKPHLVLLDNYLPDGQGITLLESIVALNLDSYVIFITAAIDMDVCGEAIRFGAFDYIIKPLFYERLEYSLSKFDHFIHTKNNTKNLNQRKIDELFNFQVKDFSDQNKPIKGIDEVTLQSIQDFFSEAPTKPFSAETVAKELGISKTTARRYLEHCLKIKFLTIKSSYGHIGRPERSYIRTW
ncbi:response regulator [Orbus wheelerorum]|uniref:response regulator n=1 Tax=Orbus wheelerorum TaxID=3074111 RepID=UPI00370D1049